MYETRASNLVSEESVASVRHSSGSSRLGSVNLVDSILRRGVVERA